jgi:hypothetical protein
MRSAVTRANHADCGATDEEFLRDEIIGSKQDIKQRLGPTENFSFPFGLPQNISAIAAAMACGTYKNVFSAYRAPTSTPMPSEF